MNLTVNGGNNHTFAINVKFYNGTKLAGSIRQLNFNHALSRQTKVWYNTASSNGIDAVYNDRGQVGIPKNSPSNTRTKYLYDLAGRVTRVVRQQYANTDTGWGKVVHRYEDGASPFNTKGSSG